MTLVATNHHPALGPAPRRDLDLRLPGPRRSPLGFLGALLVHAALLLLVAAPLSSDLSRMFGPGDSLPWARGGGGGGGGLTYISLPAPTAPAGAVKGAQAAPRLEERVPVEPPVTVPEPQAAPLTSEPEPAMEGSGAGGDTTAGTGLGQGGGTGGGAGGGLGPGAGPGTGLGPGGGDGGRLMAPVPRRMVIPPPDPPKSLRGREVRVTFVVDAEGLVSRVSIEPEIQDREYRDRLLDAMRHYRFTPARNPDGTPVPGTYVVTVTL